MKIDVLNIRMSKPMVEWLDSLVDGGVYKSRSEAVRDFVRDFVEKEAAK